MQRSIHESPRRFARICGLLYLYIIAAGTFAEVAVRSRLIDFSNSEATAHNILAKEQLFRIGFTAELLHLACDVAVAVILYSLLRVVHRELALFAAFMRLACDFILATVSVFHFVVLRFLVPDVAGFSPQESHALSLLAMSLHSDGYTISLFFFSFCCLALGYLVFASRFLPRAIGALLTIAGLCYLVQTLAHFVAPAVSAKLFPAIFLPPFIAEASFAFWLLVVGLNPAGWADQRAASASA